MNDNIHLYSFWVFVFHNFINCSTVHYIKLEMFYVFIVMLLGGGGTLLKSSG